MLMLLQQSNAIQRCIVKWRTRLGKSKGTPRSITISVSLEPRSHHFFLPIILLNAAYLSSDYFYCFFNRSDAIRQYIFTHNPFGRIPIFANLQFRFYPQKTMAHFILMRFAFYQSQINPVVSLKMKAYSTMANIAILNHKKTLK